MMAAQRFGHDQPQNNSIRIGELRKTIHGSVLCYPGTDLSTFPSRVKQLRDIRVSKLIFEGSSKIGRFGVIGKGCVSIVVKAEIRNHGDPVALKIRRSDANRLSMENDYELQKFANSFGVGPKVLAVTADFFAMEYIDSEKLGNWFRGLKTRTPKKFVRRLVRNSLAQCFLLDSNRLDHGELSNPSKHILIRKRNGALTSDAVVIDYESASRNRRPSNLTAAAQFLFFANSQSQKMRKILGISSGKKLINLLRAYKAEPTIESFESIMRHVGCAGGSSLKS
jgi:putative serine/threonine protein kinase